MKRRQRGSRRRWYIGFWTEKPQYEHEWAISECLLKHRCRVLASCIRSPFCPSDGCGFWSGPQHQLTPCGPRMRLRGSVMSTMGACCPSKGSPSPTASGRCWQPWWRYNLQLTRPATALTDRCKVRPFLPGTLSLPVGDGRTTQG